MKLSKAIGVFLKDLALRRTQATVTAYESDLQRFKSTISVDTVLHVTPEAVRHFLIMGSASGNSMATLHRRMACLRTFCKWGVKAGIWTADPCATLDAIPKPKTLPRPFTDEEVKALLALDLSPRESLARSLLLYTGLRVTPLVNIKVGDISYTPPTIRVLVKGAKQQVIQMHPLLAEQIREYVLKHTDLRPQTFVLGRHVDHHPRARDVERMTRRWGRMAGVLNCTPHRYRHTFATKLLRSGTDLRVVKEALGHEDIASTVIYTRVTAQDEASAIGRITWE